MTERNLERLPAEQQAAAAEWQPLNRRHCGRRESAAASRPPPEVVDQGVDPRRGRGAGLV